MIGEKNIKCLNFQKEIKLIVSFFSLLSASGIIFSFMVFSYHMLLLAMWEQNVHYINRDKLACLYVLNISLKIKKLQLEE